MKDKICLITGATSGIGRVTAQQLAKEGATVVLLARNREKAERTRDEIIQLTANKNVHTIIADLSSFRQIREAEAAFNKDFARLDILINNAGLISSAKRSVTEDGMEKTLQINFLAPFLLTALLFHKLKLSKEARIINVASAAYKFAKPNLDDVQMQQHFSAMRQYSNSKLYLMYFTQELARRLKNYPNITVNSLHPGFVASNFSSDAGGLLHWGFKLGKAFAISNEKGAETTLYLATDDKAINYNGLYFAQKKPVELKEKYTSPETAKKVWQIAEQMTGMKFPV